MEYHPSIGCENDLTPPKIKYKTCLRFNGIPHNRIIDVGFWSMSFSLWLKQPPSEFHRVEIIYDVLLPWLVEESKNTSFDINTQQSQPPKYFTNTVSFSLVDSKDDPHAHWRTPDRSNSSSFHCVWEASRYILSLRGLPRDHLKQFGFVLRRYFLQWATEDLLGKYAVHHPSAQNLVQLAVSIGIRPTEEQPQQQRDPAKKKLSQTDKKLLILGCQQFVKACLKEHKFKRCDDEHLKACKRFVDLIQQLIEVLPTEPAPGGLPPMLVPDLTAELEPFTNLHLLWLSSVEEYSGPAADQKTPPLTDLLALPVKIDNISQAVAAIIKCDNICDELLNRTQSSSTSSRLVLQMHIISIISELFTQLLPLPAPLNLPQDSPRVQSCIWRGPNTMIMKEMQLACLERVHKLTLKFASAWQAIEKPNREYDSERTLVAGCLLSIFDVVSRTICLTGESLFLSDLLWEDGGYCISTGVCMNHRPFEEVSNTLELLNPVYHGIRSQMLEYLESLPRVCRNTIFELRQPDKIEIKKYSATVTFLKKFLERCGYPLIPRDHPNPPPEIEALMNWLCSERTELASEHPEFLWLRDMAALFKFLATMETREAEQVRKRLPVNEYQFWKLNTEDEGGRRGFGWGRMSNGVDPLIWEAVNFRGQDFNTADIVITGFGDRELVFGEGSVVQSPADVSKLINIPMPTEDDILHADKLPTFGDTLSHEEAQVLLSYLTVDYVRIPLVVSFFASHDRVTYLFNAQLRSLLRAVLFEPGPWVVNGENPVVERVPVRRTALQQKEFLQEKFMNANIPEEKRILGTSGGLLLNELEFSPSATLDPLLSMFYSIKDLSEASIYSEEAIFILYLILLAIDVEVYVVYSIKVFKQNLSKCSKDNSKTPTELQEMDQHIHLLENYRQQFYTFLHGLVTTILNRWNAEAHKENDIETQSMVHGYLALLWTSLQPNELDVNKVTAVLGSIAFVRNWHGFGIGQNRSDLIWEGDETLTAEMRLLRFLQAQGIDTSKISKTQLEKYIQEGERRPLFLHLGRKTIRAPRLVNVKKDKDSSDQTTTANTIIKLPPSDIPEYRLIDLLQRHRRMIVSWLEVAPPKVLDSVLQNIVRIALKNSRFEYQDWKKLEYGRFLAENAEIKFDCQTAEVFWRNNELKPVPDSMTRFSDFETLFGGQALHCGVVLKNQHRHWVHIVGTEFDLQEWDKPKPNDQGIGVPKPAPSKPTPTTTPQQNPSQGFCSRCFQFNQCFTCEVCTVINCGVGIAPGTVCSVCGTPKGGVQLLPPRIMGRQQQQQQQPVEAENVIYNNVVYDRVFDPYSEEPHPHETENWAVNLVKSIVFIHYPPTEPMKWKLLLPTNPAKETDEIIRFVGCDSPDKPEATWKELISYKTRQMVQVFNLVSHGRRMFKQLTYTTDVRFSLHALPLKPKGPFRFAAGDFKKKRSHDDSLVIIRRSNLLRGIETYVPPRLLHGLIPDVLLEAFQMWQGEDNIIRGTSLEIGSQWFHYQLEIQLQKDNTDIFAYVVRSPPSPKKFTKIRESTEPHFSSSLLRSSDMRLNTEIEVQEDMVLQNSIFHLTTLGFSPAVCKAALQKNENNVDLAAAWLLDENNLPDIMALTMLEVSNTSQPNQSSSSSNPVIQTLEKEGFSRSAVQYALNLNGGDSNLAKAWLQDELNKNQISMLDELDQVTKMESGEYISPPPSKKQRMQDSMDIEIISSSNLNSSQIIQPETPNLVLFNLFQLEKSKFNSEMLNRLTIILARLEDLSHILVWGIKPENGNQAKIHVIELPRLNAKFQPEQDENGTVRLYLLDHAGWYISDDFTKEVLNGTNNNVKIRPGSQFLHNLLFGIENCVVLENSSKELQVMVANHDIQRPVIRGEPFLTILLFDRSSSGWQQVMDNHYFLYPVHTSCTFLKPQTLSATLYLLLLRFANRDYKETFRLAEACHVDTVFTAEEQWIFDQLDKLGNDLHPNAHACRLKLSLALMYSENRVKWENHIEMDRYLNKLPHVSASCKLTPEEELDVLYHCKRGTPRIKNRLEFLKVALQLKSQAESPLSPSSSFLSSPNVTIKVDQPRVPGQPWMKLCSLSLEYLEKYGTHLTRIHYTLPTKSSASALDGVECFALLWEDLILADEESGSNRQLGFFFLYEALRGKVQLSLMGRNCTFSLATLLTRAFHLKLARWGRETVEDGEQEHSTSFQMAILAALMQQPFYTWPDTPADNDTKVMLRGGINIYSAAGRGTPIKTFLELLQSEFKQFLNKGLNKANQLLNQVNVVLREKPLGIIGTVSVEPTLAIWKSVQKLQASDTASEFCWLKRPVSDLYYNFQIPLGIIGLEKFVYWKKTNENNVLKDLPVDVTNHPSSKTHVALDMLKRIKEDVLNYAFQVESGQTPVLHYLDTHQIEAICKNPNVPELSQAIQLLDILVKSLQDLYDKDSKQVEQFINSILRLANYVNPDETPSSIDRYKFILSRFSEQLDNIDMNFLTVLLLSSKKEEDLTRANPFLQQSEYLFRTLPEILLLCSRISHTNRVVAQALSLRKTLQKLFKQQTTDTSSVNSLQHTCSTLAEGLTTRRYFLRPLSDNSGSQFDPRFLVFEYIFDILLRQRQVEMVESFVTSCRKGESKVQQMIMGAGKTTVVGPLLCLILADSESLVMQVMPTALLEQTRNILRRCFSTIIIKQIYTLNFNRNVEDSVELVAELYSKINKARLRRGVVCAAPESIKSLMLKFIEQLHTLEQLNPNTLVPGQSKRSNREITRLRDSMIAKSDMGDGLVNILNLWQKGVLIMDEVDVLLHPLKSELNFPIGHKQPIDLSGYRWEIVIHMLDAIFFQQRNSVSEDLSGYVEGEKILGESCFSLLQKIQEVLNLGLKQHCIQQIPHLVLLDPTFYSNHLKLLCAKWILIWLYKHFVGNVGVDTNNLLKYLMGENVEELRPVIEKGLFPESIKLLNLATNWINSLLPHVLSKINRVSFGLLTMADLEMADPRTPKSRLLMAVPFVGKDVPSQSSEFAHPDVVIGLSILAYRYEGLRESDLKRMVMQLKQDYSRQIGTRDERPASVLFNTWLKLARSEGLPGSNSILPLSLFQPNDPKQLHALYQLTKKIPQVVHYYLRQHVFPSCMNFQELKVSACGHELGSNMLFCKRIGFSGTPSNLLPIDLGECMYEPGSDGKILNVLTSKKVVSASIKEGWTAQSLLKDICKADPPVSCLIDTGALITGMTNEEVAHFMLKYLPSWMEGVVYLDRLDRQMILLRSTGRSVSLAQCGVSPERRFSFYDQVHTTGMDIKQSPNARAVLTLGKDMTFRDYAQGAYRMRGIGKGQTIHLFIIPEVQNRIEEELGKYRYNQPELDVPAWLLINSMRMESLQFVKMSAQELFNIWRKRALTILTNEVKNNAFMNKMNGIERVKRFEIAVPQDQEWLRNSVQQFRELISYTVEDHVPINESFTQKLEQLSEKNKAFTMEGDETRVKSVLVRVAQVSEIHSQEEKTSQYNAEVVHEQEAEAQEEAEEEAEEEEQKISAFTRDDEQHNPWNPKLLTELPSGKIQDTEEAFYPFCEFHVRKEQPKLTFPQHLMLSDNFFRPRWVGIGDRKLKNVCLVMEWIPHAWKVLLQRRMQALFLQATVGCGTSSCAHAHCASNPFFQKKDPNVVAAESLKVLTETLRSADQTLGHIFCPTTLQKLRNGPPSTPFRYVVALSLAEGETIRRMIHTKQQVFNYAGIALRGMDGKVIDSSFNFFPEVLSREINSPGLVEMSIQALRFFNCEMYYSEEELRILEQALKGSPLENRLNFFLECLRLRQRERNLWTDTPLAKLFLPQEEWKMLRTRALVEQIGEAMKKAVFERHHDIYALFDRFDEDGDGKLNYKDLQQLLEWLQLGFSPKDYYEAIKYADVENNGLISKVAYQKVFNLPPIEEVTKKIEEAKAKKTIKQVLADSATRWICNNCTFVNSANDTTCAICELGWTGRRECPKDKWVCAGEKGGCTFFNPKSQFYCEVCNRARPDLATSIF